MTSLERRWEKRYQRRKARREQRKVEQCTRYDDFQRIVSYNALYRANRISRKNVCWKASVQRYQMNLLRNLHNTHNALCARQDISKGFVEFNAMERGKLRHIRSVHYSERVVQRSTCDNALPPMLSRSLIYDNGACLQGKGVDWALDRLDAHLQRFYRANGFSNQGYIVIFDFTSYFDNILHEMCRNIYRKAFSDTDILWLLDTFIPVWLPTSKRELAEVTKAKRPTGKQRKEPRPGKSGFADHRRQLPQCAGFTGRRV